MFRAIVVDKQEGAQAASLTELDNAFLREGNVEINVEYSTLNYKDALAITGRAPVVRKFPMIPGIDLAGTVTSSRDGSLNVGDRVILNGWGVGETYPGGLAERARVQSEWLVKLPERFTLRQAMQIGTAGYTAMLCVMALQRHGVHPNAGEILVTGAAGGVGSIAIALLSALGYEVAASTGRPEQRDYLKSLGAQNVIERSSLSEPGRPLAKERWSGAVDTVGGATLANVCASMRYRGVVTCCGLAQSMDFPASVAPFILRGVTLAGIDSVMAPKGERVEAWRRLAESVSPLQLDTITQEIGLADVLYTASDLLAGKVRGRVIVNVTQ